MSRIRFSRARWVIRYSSLFDCRPYDKDVFKRALRGIAGRFRMLEDCSNQPKLFSFCLRDDRTLAHAIEALASVLDGKLPFLDRYERSKVAPKVGEIRAQLIELKKTIGDDYRSQYQDKDATTPAMDVTFGCDDDGKWSYQTGDNSMTGGAYGKPHWGICELTRTSNCTELAHDIIEQIKDSQYNS